MRVLVVKLHAIGDVVMCLPMITSLRRRDPEVQISWLCDSSLAPLIELVGNIEIIPVREAQLLHGSIVERLVELARLWRKLFARSFDLVVSGYMDSKVRLFTLTTIAKERRKCPLRKNRWWAIPGRYQGDEYLRLVTAVDGPNMETADLPTVRVPLSCRMRELLEAAPKPFIAIAPGGAKNASVESPLRRWPLDSYRRLAECLMNKGYGIVVTGGAGDKWVSAGFAGLNIVDLVGHTSLVDLMAVYCASSGVITHDSGPLHLAMLAEAPTVALFGPTIPMHFVPKGKPVTVLWGGEDLPCRPCFDGKAYSPCNDNKCIKQISVAQVVAALEKLVTASERKNLLVTEIGQQGFGATTFYSAQMGSEEQEST